MLFHVHDIVFFCSLFWSDGRCWHELDLFEMNFVFKMYLLHDVRLYYTIFYLNLPICYKVGVCVTKGRITTVILTEQTNHIKDRNKVY